MIKLYKELKEKYGSPKGQWSLWCKRPKTGEERDEVAIGAILTQNTNWKNVESAFANLKREKAVSLKKIRKLGSEALASLIKPSGFYNTKAKYIFGLSDFIINNYGGLERMMKAQKESPEHLREKILEQKGVGEETADSILLYALDKPTFVIDEYTRRLVKKKRLARNMSYEFLQRLFEEGMKKDYRLYQDFHALIVIDGKNHNRNA